jgi:ATP/maltotriose-dependent transcriptional regulator MalT
MAVRFTLPSALMGDIVTLTSLVSDLEQLAPLSPSLALLHTLARAHLAFLRGKTEEALAIYEQAFANEDAALLPTYAADRSMQVMALTAKGEHERARALGEALLAGLTLDADGSANEQLYLTVSVALARVELSLGDLEGAAQRLDACLSRELLKGNPLLSGSLHRERALTAAMAADSAAFELHASAMSQHFRSTDNPFLLQQCAALETEARRLGLRVSARHSADFEPDGLDSATVIERPVALGTTSKP